MNGLVAVRRLVHSPRRLDAFDALEDDAFQVRIDDKTKIKVLKSAVSGLQGPLPQTEKK